MADQFHDSALLQFAHASGVFEWTTTPCAAPDLAGHMGWVSRKTAIFLNALVAIGLLTKDTRGQYLNTPVADECLVKSRPGYMGGVIEHQRLQWDTWTRIGDVLSTQDVLPWHQEQRLRTDAAANDAFHSAMRNLARANVPALLALPIPKGRKHVIDMAGSHGTYLAAMAHADSELTGEVWDLPGAQRLARETFDEYGCAERCAFHTKDITVPASYDGVKADLVMLNDCLHYFEPEMVSDVLALAAGVLAPGGTLLLATQLLHADGVTPAPAAGFSMHMMLNTARGGLHASPWIAQRMGDLGFSVSEWPLDPTGRYVVLLGKRNDGARAH
ncbi:methyltransferase [Rhizobacter sp. Root1221]|uniref:methyltransferase n=1 Tax=Rhizobacter sp. Root1221 TaxID=1736433 RepID=UPI0006F74A19|nr:methyltransferase [Rhizobacter sp. Root1221]KQV90445.1 hypothetical protein ASC87_28265 [Rhizobacter sp. Root1221]